MSDSSMVERPAVNRMVAGSSPAPTATLPPACQLGNHWYRDTKIVIERRCEFCRQIDPRETMQ